MPYFKYFLTVLLFSSATCAQVGDGKFGCESLDSRFFHDPALKLVAVTSQEKIKEWQTRPALLFRGFAEQKYGFSDVTFFRWHEPVKGREGAHQSANRDYEDRLALAVAISGTQGGKRWFELERQSDRFDAEELLNIQPDAGDSSDDEQTQPEEQGTDSSKASSGDEMSRWLAVQPATTERGVPLFVLRFNYNDSGANASGTIENQLLLDLRDGAPKVVRAVQCVDWEGGGACGAPDYSESTKDALMCFWKKSAGDFRCTLRQDYGEGYGPRTAEKDFYLISGKPAVPDWQTPDTPADLARWATRLRANKSAITAVAKIPGVGQATLLKRYSDLLPKTEIMVFASPAQTPSFGERLWLAIVPVAGQPVVKQIPLWVISGEELKEGNAGADYTPTDLAETFSVTEVERRPGFGAIQVTAAIRPGSDSAIHVLYWIGMEATSGTVVANAVRLASEASQYAHCGEELRDGTAISLRRKPGLAEATLLVRPQDPDPMDPGLEDTTTPCGWTGVLHWNKGVGFRVRKLAKDCKASSVDVKIGSDGNILPAVPHPKPQ